MVCGVFKYFNVLMEYYRYSINKIGVIRVSDKNVVTVYGYVTVNLIVVLEVVRIRVSND